MTVLIDSLQKKELLNGYCLIEKKAQKTITKESYSESIDSNN